MGAVGTATHYHTWKVDPYWKDTLVKTAEIGDHIFYRWPGKAGQPQALSDDRYDGDEVKVARHSPRQATLLGYDGWPDYDAQVVECEDQELARRVLRFRANHLLRNGSIAHRTPGLMVAAGLRDVAAEAHVLVVRDPRAVNDVMGLRTWAETAHERGLLSADDARRWPVALDEAVRTGRFLYAVTFFLTVGRV